MRVRRGFTIIEILVVMAIIGILSTIATASLLSAREGARIAKARHDIDAIVSAVKGLENDTGEWPGHQEVEKITTAGTNEIWDLSAPAAGLAGTDGNFPGWNGPYIGNLPKDPWGQNYFWDSDYQVGGVDRVVVGSFGPNKVGPNLYDSDDIYKIIR